MKNLHARNIQLVESSMNPLSRETYNIYIFITNYSLHLEESQVYLDETGHHHWT